MDNISQNQLYYGQKQYPQQQNYGAGGAGIENAKNVAVQKSNVGFVADKFDPMQHPGVIAKSALYALLLSIGATRAANWLVRGNIKDGMSHSQAVENSPLFKASKRFDKFVERTPILNKMSKGIGNAKKRWKSAKKPAVWNEIVAKYKEGTIAPWDKSLMYQEGKGAEALGEFVEFLKEAPDDAFTDKNTQRYVKDLMHKVDSGKINKVHAAREIIESGKLDGISAKHLDSVMIGKNRGVVDKIFGTTKNLHTSLAKAKFFNGTKMKLGPVSKAMNKITMMIAEGTGGGVLGGKMALLMNVFGFLTAFNAVAKSTRAAKEKKKYLAEQAQMQTQDNNQTFGAGKRVGTTEGGNLATTDEPPRAGEKVASFMEDFMGFMLGSYLMTFPLGVAFNKSLGMSNLGRDEKAVKAAAKHVGVEAKDKLYQETVIKYNNAIKHDKKARKYINFLEKGKLSFWQKVGKKLGLTNEKKIKSKMMSKMKDKMKITSVNPTSTDAEIINALKTKTKDVKWFTDARKMIKNAGKSKLTIKSIFKGNEINKGKFGQRLARYVVQKPLEVAGKLLAKGRFTLLSKKASIKNPLGKFKKAGGGVGRILLVGMVLTVPFRNAFMKLSHKIFGKPTFSQYDEMEGVYEKQEEATKAAQAQAQAQQQATLQQPQKPIHMPTQEELIARQQLLNQATKPAVADNNIKQFVNTDDSKQEGNKVRKLDTYTYVPSVN